MNVSDLKLGKREDVTVLFADIRNFTRLTHDLPLEEVMQLLRIYFEEMAGIIIGNNGIVGSFVGDAIVGYFGLEEPMPDAANNAVDAALAIKDQIRFINIGREIPILNGVGIDCGPVFVGDVSANQDIKQTIVIGSPINRASRFERMTRISYHRIVVSKMTYEKLSKNMKKQLVDIGRCEVRGLDGLIELYADRVEKE